jgi:hypothetical protein
VIGGADHSCAETVFLAVSRNGPPTVSYPPGGNFAAIFKPTYPSTARRPWRTSYVQRPDFKFFTLNFTLSRELHPFENRALLERSRAAFARISITRREEPLNTYAVCTIFSWLSVISQRQDFMAVLSASTDSSRQSGHVCVVPASNASSKAWRALANAACRLHASGPSSRSAEMVDLLKIVDRRGNAFHSRLQLEGKKLRVVP